MTKLELEQAMVALYDKYNALYVNIQVGKITFLEWLNAFNTYDELRKCYRFMEGRMLKALSHVQGLWCFHNDETWANLFMFSKDSEDVVKIKGYLRDLKIVWSKRPKPKRRPSNLL